MNDRTRDLFGAAPLLLWYAWGLWKEFPTLAAGYASLKAGVVGVGALGFFAQGAGILFTSFLIALLLVRSAPKASTHGAGPYAAAYVGTFASASAFFLPLAAYSPVRLAVSAGLLIVGLLLAIYALAHLGRSFAILPSARSLVTSGPYRLVRHPLYLFEEVAMVGLMLQFALPWSLGILLVHLAAQFTRMHYEERILAGAFSEYATYRAGTRRVIPGLY